MDKNFWVASYTPEPDEGGVPLRQRQLQPSERQYHIRLLGKVLQTPSVSATTRPAECQFDSQCIAKIDAIIADALTDKAA